MIRSQPAASLHRSSQVTWPMQHPASAAATNAYPEKARFPPRQASNALQSSCTRRRTCVYTCVQPEPGQVNKYVLRDRIQCVRPPKTSNVCACMHYENDLLRHITDTHHMDASHNGMFALWHLSLFSLFMPPGQPLRRVAAGPCCRCARRARRIPVDSCHTFRVGPVTWSKVRCLTWAPEAGEGGMSRGVVLALSWLT